MITLGVSDQEVSVRFYEQELGLPRMDSPPEVAFFTLGGSWLGPCGRESLAEDAGISAKAAGSPDWDLMLREKRAHLRVPFSVCSIFC